MTRSQAILPFIKLLFTDFGNLLKNLINHTREAYRRVQFKKKHMKTLKYADITELTDLDVTLDKFTYLDGTSRPIDIAFIMSMCKQFEDCNYLEIGSWKGESLINAAKVSKKCTSLSLSKEEMLKMGFKKEIADLQRLFSHGIENVNHIEANSLTFDFNSLNEKYDVIFVDGDHSYDAVKSDTANVFNLLKDENSVIIWHDTGRSYETLRFEVLCGIFDGAPADKRSKIYRVSNTLCSIYTNRDLPGKKAANPKKPSKTFTMKIEMKKEA